MCSVLPSCRCGRGSSCARLGWPNKPTRNQGKSASGVDFGVFQRSSPSFALTFTKLQCPTHHTKFKQVQSLGWHVVSFQVHAAAVASDAYTPTGVVSEFWWLKTERAWRFQCEIDLKLLQYQWIEPGDLAVLSLERRGKYASLQGTLQEITTKRRTHCEDGKKRFIVEVELSKISELAWDAQEDLLAGVSNWRLHFILVPPNEKKSIQMLQSMYRCPLRGMRLTIPRSSKEMKREMEMRPLLTIEEVGTSRNIPHNREIHGMACMHATSSIQHFPCHES